MWDAIGNLLKTFAEKHLIPSISSFVCGIIAILILPENNWMIVKIGTVWVGILVSASFFLIVELLGYVVKQIKNFIIKLSNIQYDKSVNEKEEIENMEKWWHSVDKLSPGERKILAIFVENNNTPMEVTHYFWEYKLGDSFKRNWIVSTTTPYTTENIKEEQITECNRIPQNYFDNNGNKQYKLKEDIYKILKYSKEKYGKISNFE